MATSVRHLYVETLNELLAPVRPYLDDDTVSEVMINGREEIYVERAGRVE